MPSTQRLTDGTSGDVPRGRDLGRTIDEEGPHYCRLGRVSVDLVADRDRLHRCAEHVGQQDELLALVVRHVPDVSEELDAPLPFHLGQADFPQEGVQMPGQRLHQEPQPRIARVGERGDNLLGEFSLTRCLVGRHFGSRGAGVAHRLLHSMLRCPVGGYEYGSAHFCISPASDQRPGLYPVV
jgi:hypothetical protein